MSTMSTDAKKLEKMVAKEAKGDEKVLLPRRVPDRTTSTDPRIPRT
jgi:hypothetical protein